MSGFLNFFSCKHGHTYCAGHIKIRWNDDWLSGDLFKSSDHSFVIGHTTLEENFFAYFFAANNFLDIVIHDGIGQPTHQIGIFFATLLVGIQIRFDENSASATQRGRFFSVQCQSSEFFDNINIQLFCLFFQE